jgi:hypothetical protein
VLGDGVVGDRIVGARVIGESGDIAGVEEVGVE